MLEQTVSDQLRDMHAGSSCQSPVSMSVQLILCFPTSLHNFCLHYSFCSESVFSVFMRVSDQHGAARRTNLHYIFTVLLPLQLMRMCYCVHVLCSAHVLCTLFGRASTQTPRSISQILRENTYTCKYVYMYVYTRTHVYTYKMVCIQLYMYLFVSHYTHMYRAKLGRWSTHVGRYKDIWVG